MNSQKVEELLKDPATTIITEGGSETIVLFDTDFELKDFCLWEIFLKDDKARELMFSIFQDQAKALDQYKDKVTLMFDTPTWRASGDWFEKLGYPKDVVKRVAKEAVSVLKRVQSEVGVNMIIGGQIGPRGDGYTVEGMMSAKEAAEYHLPTVQALVEEGVNAINVLTLNYLEEAQGAASACSQCNIPYTLVFTLETDGTLPSGQSLEDAIRETDAYIEEHGLRAPAIYGINCCHPTHCPQALTPYTRSKVFMMRANPSKMSHEELDNAEELDAGVPSEFAADMHSMAKEWGIKVLGGCCGSDKRHLEELAKVL